MKESKVKNPWTLLDSSVHYDNNWIRLREDKVLNPAGKPGIYGVVMVKSVAVGVVPLDSDDNIYLVGQYRYPLNQYSWEIPEGGCPIGEDVLDAAKRELREETGIIAAKYTQLMDLHTSNCITDEKAIVFIAEDFQKVGEIEQEETEELQLKKVHFSKAFEMVMKGEITDAISVAAILKLHHLRQKK
ncbi:MAG: NUDIX hydrolase [Chitinophagaceae bacterium]|nr:MAG: NUDIX hydrolase [Chitinophagaceae bacterium]